MNCLQSEKSAQEVAGAASDEMHRIGEEARSLARDLISYRTGSVIPPPSRSAVILRRLTDGLEDSHSAVLSNMCNRLNVLNGTARAKFVQVADEVFRDGINWGRIVAVYAFGGKLAQYCMRNGLEGDVAEIILWLGNYISSLSSWIQAQGGWASFEKTFGDALEQREKLWWKKICLAAVGFGAIATLIYQQSTT